ncbi:type I-C CRISPR-associated protein Cas8c/Csd1 [Bifidobacterium asteroides]|nr:type I-C CRISPR-associated protein Cas8c/Csd1 [Bifidobacterium asteroides]
MDNSIYPPLAKIHKICTTYSIWSYGKQRGLVSPVGAQEATAYADALNYMLATPGWHAPIGRAVSVVCWSDDADSRYPDALLHQAGIRQTPPPEDADGPYPAELPRLVEEDIRRAGDVSGTDAMLLRAYYARRPDKACPHGILGPGTHEDSDCLGYRLGRVYYMYAAQIRRLNSPGTFKPLLRQTLCSTAARPSHGIPALDRRLRTGPSKADRRWYLHLARAVTPVGDHYPDHLDAPARSAFYLGYKAQALATIEAAGWHTTR